MTSSTPLAHSWSLDKDIAFLNHGSFGACPVPVLSAQDRLRKRMERQPVQWFMRDLEGLLDEARARLARFLGASPAAVAFVPNATTGVNTVLRSLRFAPGDELLLTNQTYGACRNAAAYVAELTGARVVVAELPFPITGPDEAIERVLAAVTPNTRLALLDHVVSPTGLVLPVERLVAELHRLRVETLVDGAHAPGQVPVDLTALGAAYYTGNCHKWLFAPKGAGFLVVREDMRSNIRPLVISHGASSPRTDKERFLLELDWVGTTDPTPYLAVTEALRFGDMVVEGGWPELRRRNRDLALFGRRLLAEALEIDLPCPDDMVASLAALPLPPGDAARPAPPSSGDPLQAALLERYRIEVPIIPWPAPPARLLRISAQLYNGKDQYQRLAAGLRAQLARAA